MTLGLKVKKLRIEKWLGIKEIENDTQLSSSYIYRLETGSHSNPSILTLKILCAYYGISTLSLNSMVIASKYLLSIFENWYAQHTNQPSILYSRIF